MGVLMGVRTGDVSQLNFRGARFVQVGTRQGSAFTSSEERGRGFGSVFRQYLDAVNTGGDGCLTNPVAQGQGRYTRACRPWLRSMAIGTCGVDHADGAISEFR